MTEKEKALLGLEFRQGDPELRQRRELAEKLCFAYNNLSPDDRETKRKILEELIPDKQEGCYIKSPFLCEYGEYISLGRNFLPTTTVS